VLTQLVVLLNQCANAAAGVALTPLAWLPGWLSATLVAVLTGLGMLVAFKYTSNQAAIKQARRQIKANLVALSLFKDSVAVGLRSQVRILRGAGQLMVLSIIPMLVMFVPMCLLLSQLALWYQARPLRPGEDAVVSVYLKEGATAALHNIRLANSKSVDCTVGPVRVPAKDMVCWNVLVRGTGLQHLSFEIGEQSFHKELAVSQGFMPTSLKRPARNLLGVLLHPREQPFALDSLVQSIEVAYPERSSWTFGSNTWLIYWFIVSLVAAFAARPLLNVNI
jgi:hypothetical protein